MRYLQYLLHIITILGIIFLYSLATQNNDSCENTAVKEVKLSNEEMHKYHINSIALKKALDDCRLDLVRLSEEINNEIICSDIEDECYR